MESLFDVVVSEPVTLDTESNRSVFVSWVRGLSTREVVVQRLADFHAEVRWETRKGCLVSSSRSTCTAVKFGGRFLQVAPFMEG